MSDSPPPPPPPPCCPGKYLARQTLAMRGVVPMLAAPMSEGSGAWVGGWVGGWGRCAATVGKAAQRRRTGTAGRRT